MKILHLADLHLGKKVNGFCMLQEQRHVLEQSIELVKKQNVQAVLICGDVFDRPIPTIAALEIFEEYLLKLVKFLLIHIFSITKINTSKTSIISSN